MPYAVQSKKTGDTYYLFKKDVTLRGGQQQTIYYFARDPKNPKGTPVMELPEGMETIENPRTGLPMVRKIK